MIIGTIGSNGHYQQKQDWQIEKSGQIRLTETWLVNTDDVPTVVPAFQSAHGTFTYLFFQSVSVTSANSGLSQMRLVYEGANLSGGGGSTATTPNYFMTTGTMQVPINQHRSIATWIASEKTAGRNPCDAAGLFVGWKLGAVSTGTKSLYGVDSYEYPTAVWNKEWVTTDAPGAADLAKIGTVDTPAGSPPTPTNTNWLCVENSWRKLSTSMYSRAQRWKLSQINAWGGWNTDVY